MRDNRIPLRHLFTGLIFTVIALRLLAMMIFPVTDTTESRYAEIARLMWSSGQWLVPQIEAGTPFWGKPPLYAWISAISLKLFGFNDFAIRLPHFLAGLAVLLLLPKLSETVAPPSTVKHSVTTSSMLAILILLTCPLFYLSAGTVMTDAVLLLSTTIAMTGFWKSMSEASDRWGLVFFIGLAIGMLAKGPVAILMTALPVLAWLFVTRRWQDLKRLPWVSGSLLALLIFVPWYIAAELQSPGFLEYFLLGEHVLRFIQPGWEGDLYGNAHKEIPGMIWLLWFQATGLWGLIAVLAWIKRLRVQGLHLKTIIAGGSEFDTYLICWMLAPLVFFTFSSNILWTYVITGLPAFALLLSRYLMPAEAEL